MRINPKSVVVQWYGNLEDRPDLVVYPEWVDDQGETYHAPQRDCPSDVPSTSTRNGTHLTREHLEVFGFELVDNALTPAVLKLISECRLVRWKLGKPLGTTRTGR